MQSRVEQLEDRRLLTAVVADPIDVVDQTGGAESDPAPVQVDSSSDDVTIQTEPVLLASPIFIADPVAQPAAPVVDPSFSAPTAAQNADGSVQLSWSPLAGAQSYSVQRSDAGGDFYDVYADVNGTAAVDSSAQAGMQYSYRIVANPDGDAPAASGSTDIVTAGVAAPDSINVVNSSDSQIDLNWSWSGASTGVTYTLQRAVVDSNGNEGAFQTIASGLTDTQYSDTGMTPGGSYAYQVVAVAQGQESAPSYSAWADAVGQLTVTSTTIDNHVDVGQTATVQLTYDVPPGGGHPSSITVYWGDGTSSDISDPTTAGDIQTTLSADGTQMTITATHQFTGDNTCSVEVAVRDGTKATTQDVTVVVGTGQGPNLDPIYFGTTNAGGIYLADGVAMRGDVPSALTSGTANNQTTETPVFAMGAGASANSPFSASSPAVFDMASAHSLFDLAQTPAAAPAAPEQPFGTVIIPATETRTEKAQQDNLDFLDASAPAQPSPADTQTATAQPAASEQSTAPAPVPAAPTPVMAPAPAAPAGQQSQVQPTAPIPASSRGAVQAPAQTPRSASLAPAAVALLLAQRCHRPSAETKKRARR